MFIYQRPGWPNFSWDNKHIDPLVAKVQQSRAELLNSFSSVDQEITLETLSNDVLMTSSIEDEELDAGQVKSSVAKQLGIDIGGVQPVEQEVEGIVSVTIDATANSTSDLTKKRLLEWHSLLFPGAAGIKVGKLRDDKPQRVRVVSGVMGKEKVHFVAPEAARLEPELDSFISWANKTQVGCPLLIKAAIAHLWFLTLHPFEDGNGRIARAISDMFLARADKTQKRYYSMSAQIRRERGAYYQILETTQKDGLEVTPYLDWYLDCLMRCLEFSKKTVSLVNARSMFWQNSAGISLSERQIKVLKKLVSDPYQKITSRKWSKIGKCSMDTAQRDINDLLTKQLLIKGESGGRSSHYFLKKD